MTSRPLPPAPACLAPTKTRRALLLPSSTKFSKEGIVDLPLIGGPLPGPNAPPDHRTGYPRALAVLYTQLSAGGRPWRRRNHHRRGWKPFLDFAAGIAVVATGHCHPSVVKAIQDQAARLIHIVRDRFLLRKYGGAGGRSSPRSRPAAARAGSTSATPAPRPWRRLSSLRATIRVDSDLSRSPGRFMAGPWARSSLTASKGRTTPRFRTARAPECITRPMRTATRCAYGKTTGYLRRRVRQGDRRSIAEDHSARRRSGRDCRGTGPGRGRLYRFRRRSSWRSWSASPARTACC